MDQFMIVPLMAVLQTLGRLRTATNDYTQRGALVELAIAIIERELYFAKWRAHETTTEEIHEIDHALKVRFMAVLEVGIGR